ncbi:Glucocorticoid receptor [Dissostichus eleginoides]|uniref:Glucocorticoid receptor n=1 Tax=Dissostichus eleginoides TaxID=100907 RepID=A0AAD9BJ29_DISEL|nr:Glucocorticoid receptor [Dissostichus eleginoides]
MDQGGLKRNGNQDDSLTFGETGSGVGRETGDTAGLLLQSAGHLLGPRSMPQPTVAPNGHGVTKDQGKLGGLFDSPQHHIQCEGSDMKEGKITRMQKQHQDSGVFNIEDSLPLLKQNISNLNSPAPSVISTSVSSILGNLPLPDLFPQHIKQEGHFSMDKDLENYSCHTAVRLCDLDEKGSRLMEDTEIWQDLDLPNSLPEISDFELDSEVAHLDNILHDSRGGGGPVSGLLKETKPLVGNGVNCNNVNGTDQQHQPIHHQQQQQHHLLQHQLHHQQQPASLLSSVMIKEEKDPDDSFIHIRTPGVVKQEKQENTGFCQSQCLQSTMSSLHGGSSMSSPMGVGAGASYLYRVNPSSTVGLQDQEPFGMYSNLPLVGETWARGNRFGESSGLQRGDDGLPSAAALASFSVNFSST